MIPLINKAKYFLKNHAYISFFVISYLVFSLLTYKAYPIANGEEFRYLRGKETLNHFLYGQFAEKLIQPTPNYFLYNLYPMIMVYFNPKFYYEWFHLMNLLFSTLGFVAVYLLGLQLTKSRLKTMLTIAALILFPPFLGQLAINPIDMPFMVCYLFLLWALINYSEEDANHWSTLLIGLLFGFTQSLRQLGFTLYLVVVVVNIYDFYAKESNRTKFSLRYLWKHISSKIIKYIYIFIIANFLMVITWPNFAIDYFKNFKWYLFVGSNFYLWDFGLLFFGKFLENWQRPWYYLPLFQLITYPIYILGGFLLTGVYFKKKLSSKPYFIIVFTLVLNYLLYLVLHPVLYDGIRHFLYLLPLTTLLAVDNLFSLFESLKNRILKFIFLSLIFVNLTTLVAYSDKEFPYLYPYFNEIAFLFGNPYKLFESDYSNTKYREASEWIRDVYLNEHRNFNDSSVKTMLKVYPCDNAYAVDYFSYKKFLTVINKDEADLIVCDYRNLKQSGYTNAVIKTFYLNGHDVLYVLEPN